MRTKSKGTLMRFFLLLFFFCVLGPSLMAWAEPERAPSQTQKLVLRKPDAAKLKEMQESRDFLYKQDIQPDTSWWDRFWIKVGNFLNRIFSGKSYSSFWKYVLYAFVIGVTGFVILKLLKVDFTGLFGRKPAPVALAYETYRENIHELDFQAMIEEAEAQGDYRRAIRLYYLKTLKTLTDREVIDWRPGKTNRSYVSEVKEYQLRQSFEQITSLFEYVWYGGSSINEERFVAVRQNFRTFDHSLTAKA